MKLSHIVSIGTILFFSGCATQDRLATGVGSVESTTQQASGETQKIFTDVKYGAKKILNSFGDGWNSLYGTILENKAIQIIVPDNYILDNRKKLVIWSSEYNNIRYDKKLDTIEGLTKYFFTIEQNKFKQKFLIKNPKPKYNKYLSDADNLNRFYQYEIALKESKYEWDLGIESLKKKVVSKALQVYYGTPKLRFITYNPNFLSKQISFTIESSKNNFKETIRLKVEPNEAKDLEESIDKIKIFVYFDTNSENKIELVGASLVLDEKEYMGQITHNVNIYKSDLRVEGSNIDYTNEELDYALMNKEIKKPDWYKNYEQSDKLVGLGYHVTLEKARELARVNLAGKIKGYSAKLSSKNTKELQRDGSGLGKYSQNYTSKVEIESSVNFKVKDIKDEKYNEIFFVAVEEMQ